MRVITQSQPTVGKVRLQICHQYIRDTAGVTSLAQTDRQTDRQTGRQAKQAWNDNPTHSIIESEPAGRALL